MLVMHAVVVVVKAAVELTMIDEGGHFSKWHRPWQVPAIGIEVERAGFVSYCEARSYGCMESDTRNMKTPDIDESHTTRTSTTNRHPVISGVSFS
jgi:hypothetical protein